MSTHVDLIPIDFLGQTLRVHRRVADAFKRVAARLRAAEEQDPFDQAIPSFVGRHLRLAQHRRDESAERAFLWCVD